MASTMNRTWGMTGTLSKSMGNLPNKNRIVYATHDYKKQSLAEIDLVAFEAYIITSSKLSDPNWMRVTPLSHQYLSGMAPKCYLTPEESIWRYPYFDSILHKDVAKNLLSENLINNFCYLLRPGTKKNRFILSILDGSTFFNFELKREGHIFKSASCACNAEFEHPEHVVARMFGTKFIHCHYQRKSALIPGLGVFIEAKTVELSSIKNIEKIGGGNFGVVYKGKLQGKDVAMKRMKIERNLTEKEKEKSFEDYKRECFNMVGLCHKHVLPIVAVCVEDHVVYIITPFCANGSLKQYLMLPNIKLKMENEKYQTRILLRYLKEISSGMNYVHKKDIVHGDLAARNIFIDSKGKCIVADFGQAFKFELGQKFMILPPKHVVPIPICSPEVFKELKVYYGLDVWQFGMLALEIFEINTPHYSFLKMKKGQTKNKEISRYLIEGNAPQKCENMPDFIYDSIKRRCFQFVPTYRSDFAEITQEMKNLAKVKL